MEYLYMDEKGTQETIKALGNSKMPYTDEQKIELGTDNMKDFIATVVKISDIYLENVEFRYSNLEEEYKATSQKFKNGDGELKGSDILKKNKYGIASLNTKNIKFYDDLVDILIENKILTHVFAVNKIGLVIDKRFTDWILKLGEKGYLQSIYIFKYVLIKYVENEASKEVIQSLFDKDISNNKVLYLILKDLKEFINKHGKKIRFRDRMQVQLQSYNELKILIEKYKIYLIDEDFKNESDKFIKLDWNKAVFSIDLWLNDLNMDRGDIELSLDDGIKKTPFDKLRLAKIHEGLDSENNVGLRIADVLVVLIGNCISKLTLDMKYDKNEPYKQKLLSEEWFDLNREQFNLVKKLNKYLFITRYSFTNDLYFDDSLVFNTYLGCIAQYDNFEDFKKVELANHSKNHMNIFAEKGKEKYNAMVKDELLIKGKFGSVREGILQGSVRPF